MPIPTKSQWAALKSNAGIAKSAWWKPADAAVGPALAKLETKKAAWKSKKDLTSAQGYAIALFDLHKAFTKFLNKKDVATAGPLAASINGWMTEVATKHAQIQAKLPGLEKADAKEMAKQFDTFVL